MDSSPVIPQPSSQAKPTADRGLQAELGRMLVRLRDPRRLAAILLLGLAGGIAAAFLVARGDLAGDDARAYWAAVRVWLAGGDPYHPPEPFMPYPYAPWLLPALLPWGLLPWEVAWFVWRSVNVLLLAWSAHWAYRQRPLATALVLAVLAAPIAVTLDTGNVTLVLALMVWAAQFTRPWVGGLLWALTVSSKWFPALLFVFLPPRTRLAALGWLGVAILLSLATFPQTIDWVITMVTFPRPVRVDYLVLLWAAVPWVWRHPSAIESLRAAIARSLRRLRVGGPDEAGAAQGATAPVRQRWEARLRGFFGVG